MEDSKNTIENEDEIKALEKLKRVVDLTRRARMEAADRLIASERFIQNINVYYSCFSVILSVFCLLNNNIILSVISTILTAILAISIVFLNAQHYGQRSHQFHNDFLELYQLLFDIDTAIRQKQYSNTCELEKRYIDLLKSIENHTQQDFFQTLFLTDRVNSRNRENYTNRLQGIEKATFWGRKILVYILKIIIWIFPILGVALVIITWN